MSKQISDETAIEFAIGFYDPLGAGRSIDYAFKFGCNGISMANIPENLTPQLLKKSNDHNFKINGNQAAVSKKEPEECKNRRIGNFLFEYNEEQASTIKVIEFMLRQVVGDNSVTIVDIEKSSIKLILEGSQAGLE